MVLSKNPKNKTMAKRQKWTENESKLMDKMVATELTKKLTFGDDEWKKSFPERNLQSIKSKRRTTLAGTAVGKTDGLSFVFVFFLDLFLFLSSSFSLRR